jgi:NADH pyrophosphatase NudC (nudix superfamily)
MMAESRQPTEEEVREVRRWFANFSKNPLATDVVALCDSWLAQRDVVAAQDRALRRIAAIKDQHTWSEDDALEAAEIAAAVVSEGPEPPTRFCGVCGHPSVSAYAGGWKCRDCGAVVSGTPEGEK